MHTLAPISLYTTPPVLFKTTRPQLTHNA